MIDKNFIAPALPLPNREYDQLQQLDGIRALRLYFNQLDNYFAKVILDALNGGVGGYGITFPHIAASDSTDQYASANTPTVVAWNTLDSGYLWALNAPGSATAQVAGVYTIRYSLQFANTDNVAHDAVVWLRLNGTDVPNSATSFSVPARKSAGVPSYLCGFSEATFEVAVNDEIELVWATAVAASSGGALGVYIYHDPAQTVPYSRPAIPSAIGSIAYVSALSPT